MPTEMPTTKDNATTRLQSRRVLMCQGAGAPDAKLLEVLTAAGHTVAGEAHSGQECLELAEKATPDVVLMEITLPGMNGLATMQQLMTQCPMPIVVLTARGDDHVVAMATAAGAMAYLMKPVSPEQLLASLHVAVAWFARMRQLKLEVQTLSEALHLDKVMERAKGALMECAGLTADQALERLQETSRKRGRPIEQVAEEVIGAAQLMAQVFSGSRPRNGQPSSRHGEP